MPSIRSPRRLPTDGRRIDAPATSPLPVTVADQSRPYSSSTVRSFALAASVRGVIGRR